MSDGSVVTPDVTDVSARQAIAYGVSDGFFDLFWRADGHRSRHVTGGRRQGAPPVVVLSHALWISAYGGRPEVLASTINLGNRSARVVGVALTAKGMARLRGAQCSARSTR